MDSRRLVTRLRGLADNLESTEQVGGTGAFFGSDAPFIRDLADEIENAAEHRLKDIAGRRVESSTVIDAIAKRLTVA